MTRNFVVPIAAAFLFLTWPASARRFEQFTIPDSEFRYLKSKHNGIDYRIYVGLPPGYRAASRSSLSLLPRIAVGLRRSSINAEDLRVDRGQQLDKC